MRTIDDILAQGDDCCEASVPPHVSALPFVCTLPTGHEGDHVAEGSAKESDSRVLRELARWPR